MQNQETTLIIQNPDGTIQIGTQPHIKYKHVIQCWSCKIKLIFDISATYVKCSSCGSLNGVPGKSDGKNNYLVIQCPGCRAALKAQQNIFAIQCPYCRTITCL